MRLMVTGEAPHPVWLLEGPDLSWWFRILFFLFSAIKTFLQSLASCVCPRGFAGVYCEQDIDDCVDHRCSEHGVCLDQQNNYTCLCLPGFEGRFCQMETNECNSVPCARGATCVDLISDYRCLCPPGFEGENTKEVCFHKRKTPRSLGWTKVYWFGSILDCGTCTEVLTQPTSVFLHLIAHLIHSALDGLPPPHTHTHPCLHTQTLPLRETFSEILSQSENRSLLTTSNNMVRKHRLLGRAYLVFIPLNYSTWLTELCH